MSKSTFQLERFNVHEKVTPGCTILVHGPPQCGKITLIRDWIKQLDMPHRIFDASKSLYQYDIKECARSILWFQHVGKEIPRVLSECIEQCRDEHKHNIIIVSGEYLGDFPRNSVRLKADFLVSFHTKISAVRNGILADWYGSWHAGEKEREDAMDWEWAGDSVIDKGKTFFQYFDANTEDYSALVTDTRKQSYKIQDFTFQYRVELE